MGKGKEEDYVDISGAKEKEEKKLRRKLGSESAEKIEKEFKEYMRSIKSRKESLSVSEEEKTEKPEGFPVKKTGRPEPLGKETAKKPGKERLPDLGKEKSTRPWVEEPDISEDGPAEDEKGGRPSEKSHPEVKERLETDIDKLYELVRERGILKLKDASKEFGIEMERVEEWGRILEDHKLIKLHYPPVGEPVLILKKFKSDIKEIKDLKEKKRPKPGRRIFITNIVVLLAFIGFVVFYTVKIPMIKISRAQAYLALIIIVIIVLALILIKLRRSRRNRLSGK